MTRPSISAVLLLCCLFPAISFCAPPRQSPLLPAGNDGSAATSPRVSAHLDPGPRRDDGIPTRYESTVLGRRLLALARTGVISTVFPSTDAEQFSADDGFLAMSSSGPRIDSHPASSVSGLPIALPDYLADCERPSRGNPTLLLLDPSTVSRNLAAQDPSHRNLSLSVSWWDHLMLQDGSEKPTTRYEAGEDLPDSPSSPPPPYYRSSPLSLPRLSLLGYMEHIPTDVARSSGLVDCYLRSHPDARWWLPGDRHAAHHGRWARMVVQQVYWLGGFGDRAYLGWFDVDEWTAVTEEQWKHVRLPGERLDTFFT